MSAIPQSSRRKMQIRVRLSFVRFFLIFGLSGIIGTPCLADKTKNSLMIVDNQYLNIVCKEALSKQANKQAPPPELEELIQWAEKVNNPNYKSTPQEIEKRVDNALENAEVIHEKLADEMIVSQPPEIEETLPEIEIASPEEITAMITPSNLPKKASSTKPLQVNFEHSILSKAFHAEAIYSFNQTIRKMLKRMAFEGDIEKYIVKLVPSIEINANVQTFSARITFYTGMILHVKNEAELAYVLAHEVTHANPNFLKGLGGDFSNEALGKIIEDFNVLTPAHREEIRADLGATYRLILGGYNPWAGYYQEKSFEKFDLAIRQRVEKKKIKNMVLSFTEEYVSTHPSSSVRMAAIKAFLLDLQKKMDLSEAVARPHPSLPLPLRLLKLRLMALRLPAMLVRSTIFKSAAAIIGTSSLFISQFIWLENASYTSEVAHNIIKVEQWIVGISFGLLSIAGVVTTGQLIKDSSVFTQAKNYFYHLFTSDFKIFKSKIETLIKKGELDEVDLFSFTSNIAAKAREIEDYFSFTNEITSKKRYKTGRQNGVKAGRIFTEKAFTLLFDTITNFLIQTPTTANPKKRIAFIEMLIDGPELNNLPPYLFENKNFRNALYRLFQTTKRFKDLSPEQIILAAQVDESKKTSALLRLQLMQMENKVSEFDPIFKLKWIDALAQNGLTTTAAKHFFSNYPKMLEVIFTESNSNTYLTEKFYQLYKQLEVWRSTGPTSRVERNELERLYLKERKKRAVLPKQQIVPWIRLGQVAPVRRAWVIRKIPKLEKLLDSVSIRGKDNQWLKNYFNTEFKNLEALHEAVLELKTQNVPMDWLSPYLHEALLKRPDWIKGQKEIDLILGREYFWPAINFKPDHLGEFEKWIFQAIKEQAEKYPDVWAYDPARSEALHQMIIEQLKIKKIYPDTIDTEFELWKSLTDRGVTSTSDDLFISLYERANLALKNKLSRLAREGRVWEQSIKGKLVQKAIRATKNYKLLLNNRDPEIRRPAINAIIAEIQKSFPDGGITYEEILETFSQNIRSTFEEAKLIESMKRSRLNEKEEDAMVRTFSALSSEILTWKHQDQYNFMLYLQGSRDPDPAIVEMFKNIGAQRVRRGFQLLPMLARTGILDNLLSSTFGLLPKVDLESGWAKVIVEHGLEGVDPQSKEKALQTLDGFLYSLKATGNEPFQAYVMAYILALPKSERPSVGQFLKDILEFVGGTGIKIGQGMVTAEMLGKEDSEILSILNEKAKEPTWFEAYLDLQKIGNGELPPVVLEAIIGSASIKYTLKAALLSAPDLFTALKIFREEALVKTKQELLQLEAMADYMVTKYGKDYGVFKTIVRSSVAAMKAELDSQAEVAKGIIAGEEIYLPDGENTQSMPVPQEALLFKRLIAAQFADGISFLKLTEAEKAMVASIIVEKETKNIFKDVEIIWFCPDRHPGNYRIKVMNGQGVIVTLNVFVRPIDFGQVQPITREEREQVIQLFALAEIIKRTGYTDWAKNKIATVLNLNAQQRKKVGNALATYFPAKQLNPILAYYTLLAAIDSGGVLLRNTYFDFIKAVVQMKRYEKYIPEGSPVNSAFEVLRERVENAARTMAAEMTQNLSLTDQARLRLRGINSNEAKSNSTTGQ